MIKILPLDVLGLSNSTKEKKCSLPFGNICITVVPEIFVCEKYVKCANEMTHDFIC